MEETSGLTGLEKTLGKLRPDQIGKPIIFKKFSLQFDF